MQVLHSAKMAQNLPEDTDVCSANVHTMQTEKGATGRDEKLLWDHKVGGDFLLKGQWDQKKLSGGEESV